MSTLSFASAYRQLDPTEKVYVDGYVREVERDAARQNDRISNALHRPLSVDVIAASRGMLDRPLVKAAIVERINDIAMQSELTGFKVIRELSAIAFSSVEHYMTTDENGHPCFNLSACTPEQLSAIQSIKVEETLGRHGTSRKFEFKLWDKPSAIASLMKYMGLLDADNPQWKADQPRGKEQAALPAATTPERAGDLYAQMING